MTHNRAGAAVFASGAGAALAAIAAYVATRWTGIHSSFGRAFVAGATCITVGLALALAFAGPRPLSTNAAITLLIFATVIALNRVGGSLIGALLGLLAPTLLAFAAYALWTALRPQVARPLWGLP